MVIVGERLSVMSNNLYNYCEEKPIVDGLLNLFYVRQFDGAHRLIVVAGLPLFVLTDDAVHEQKHALVLLNLRLVDLGPEAM